MSIWSRLFGRSSAKRSGPIDQPIPSADGIATHKLLFSDVNKEAVQSAMRRLEAAGLRIDPSIDRTFAVLRCLYDFEQMFSIEELTSLFAPGAGVKPFVSFDLRVFWQLASETDSLYCAQDIDVLMPQRPALSSDELDSLCDKHYRPIFENAAEISFVNDGFLADQHTSDYLQQIISELAELARGDLEIMSIISSGKSGRLLGQIILSGGQSVSLDIVDVKRPDITPLFIAMNELAEGQNVGRFLASATGSGESLVALYLRPDEQVRFRAWEKDQYSGGGALIGVADWIE